MFEDGAKYRTINYARSAISKLHSGFDGIPAGQHILVKQAVKAAFRLRPPLPKYKNTFDITIVLTYVKQILGNNSFLSLRLLTLKTLFLLSFSSLSRVSTICRLSPDIEQHRGHLIIPLVALEKQARGTMLIHFMIMIKNMIIMIMI